MKEKKTDIVSNTKYSRGELYLLQIEPRFIPTKFYDSVKTVGGHYND